MLRLAASSLLKPSFCAPAACQAGLHTAAAMQVGWWGQCRRPRPILTLPRALAADHAFLARWGARGAAMHLWRSLQTLSRGPVQAAASRSYRIAVTAGRRRHGPAVSHPSCRPPLSTHRRLPPQSRRTSWRACWG